MFILIIYIVAAVTVGFIFGEIEAKKEQQRTQKEHAKQILDSETNVKEILEYFINIGCEFEYKFNLLCLFINKPDCIGCIILCEDETHIHHIHHKDYPTIKHLDVIKEECLDVPEIKELMDRYDMIQKRKLILSQIKNHPLTNEI